MFPHSKKNGGWRRRDLLAAAMAMPLAAQSGVKLGIDVFALRSQGFGPFEYLDYAARKGLRVVHLSEIRFLGGMEEAHLRKLKSHADGLGVQIEVGMMSICPTSKRFDGAAGMAEEQLARMARAAKIVGAPFFRAVLGSLDDRREPGGIEPRIEAVVRVLKNSRPLLLDLGMKVAVENHAGDMQARELKALVEAAGTDIAGVCLDSANPLWAIEDPHLALETLVPYVLTSSVRDSMVWLVPEGLAVAWTRMGEGNVDIGGWVRKYVQLCPGRALSIETIVTGPRVFPFRQPGFWKGYENVRAAEFQRLIALAEKGTPRSAPPKVSAEEAKRRELEDFEVSLEYVKGIV